MIFLLTTFVKLSKCEFIEVVFNSIQFNIFISDCHTDVHINIKNTSD